MCQDMFPAVETEPLTRQIAGAIRANPGPLALAVLLLLASRISQIVTYDAAVKGVTLAAVAETALIVAAHALATLTGCWAVISGGQPAGFRGFSALPPGRIGLFLGYAVVFNLWLLALTAVFVRMAHALLDGQPGLTVALVVGCVATATALVMYVQLGFLFPDIVITGQTGIIFVMALGLASARRVVAVLALPVAALLLPQAVLAALHYEPTGMARAAAAWPSVAGMVTAAVVAALGAVGALGCAVAMTVLYQDLTQRLPGGAWR